MKGEDRGIKLALRAAWAAPMDSQVFRDGAVVFSGNQIIAAGPFRAIQSAHPDADVLDLGNAVILPGLVNAHTHLELSGCQAGDSPNGSFAEWILSMRERNRLPDAAAATSQGIAQCLKFGVTTVGDI